MRAPCQPRGTSLKRDTLTSVKGRVSHLRFACQPHGGFKSLPGALPTTLLVASTAGVLAGRSFEQLIRQPRASSRPFHQCSRSHPVTAASRTVTLVRREAILAQRKALQIRAFLARREHYRKQRGTNQDAGAGTPELHPNSPPDLSHSR